MRDGITLRGDKSLFIDALRKSEGRKGLEVACGLEKTYNFLRHAGNDMREAKEIADIQLAADGAHRACVEGLYVLFRKHGLPIPGSHEEERERLQMLEEIYRGYKLSERYSVLFQHLYAECFYHGECKDIKKWIAEAKKFLDDISRLL